MHEQDDVRIVLLGKSGCGKTSLANTILGETVFKGRQDEESQIRLSEAHSKVIDGLRLTVVDTPGLFGGGERSGAELGCDLISCLTLCAPGPHAALLVLCVERFTPQEQAVVDLIQRQFGKELLHFTSVVFTHGDQLPEHGDIAQFVSESRGLRELVDACGGRCHVVDNRYWKNLQPNSHRSNAFQVKQIIASIKKTVAENSKHFSNAALERVEQEIQAEQRRLHCDTGLSPDQSRDRARTNVINRYMEEAANQKPDRPHGRKYIIMMVAVGVVGVTAYFMALKHGLSGMDSLVTAANTVMELPVVELPVMELPVVESVPIIDYGISDLMDRLRSLYERTYDPFNLFN